MKIQLLSSLCLSYALLCYPSLSSSQMTQGSLFNIGNPTPTTNALNIMYNAMEIVYAENQAYFQAHQHCAPEDSLKRTPGQGNIIAVIYNTADCGIIGQFGNSVPSPLKGKIIRIQPKKEGSNVDFAFRQSVTNIDFGTGSGNQSFLRMPQAPFAPSPTVLPSNFGPTPSASLIDTLRMDFATLSQRAAAAIAAETSESSSSSSGGSTGGSQNNYTIQPVG